MTGPTSSYLVCATPRSGSTLLCEALKATGVAGRPEEYFEVHPRTGRPPRPRDFLAGVSDPAVLALVAAGGEDDEPPPARAPDPAGSAGGELERILAAGTTPNGVFGAKLMWSQLPAVAALARGRTRLSGRVPAELLPALFPGLRYIWVRRRDSVRQAVSLWRALQTRTWRLEDGEDEDRERPPRYAFAAIDHLARQLAEHDAGWERFFADAGAEPLELTYERLAADRPGAVAVALRHLGLPVPPAAAIDPGLRRQADELSEAWVAAYRAAARPSLSPTP